MRIVSVTFKFSFLHYVAQHKNLGDFVLLDHSPKVVKGCFGERSLGGNGRSPSNFNKVSIDIIINVLFLLLFA